MESCFEMFLEMDMSAASALTETDLRCSPGRRVAFVSEAFAFPPFPFPAEALVF